MKERPFSSIHYKDLKNELFVLNIYKLFNDFLVYHISRYPRIRVTLILLFGMFFTFLLLVSQQHHQQDHQQSASRTSKSNNSKSIDVRIFWNAYSFFSRDSGKESTFKKFLVSKITLFSMAGSSDHNSSKPRPRARRPIHL